MVGALAGDVPDKDQHYTGLHLWKRPRNPRRSRDRRIDPAQLLWCTGFLTTVEENARGVGTRTQVDTYRIAFWVILAVFVIASAAHAIIG
jgi:hypothetical protein